MSDIRTKLLLGTTISAVSVMLVMAIGISSEQKVADASSTLGLLGNFQIMVQNPDGTTSYMQTDNFIAGVAKDNVAALVILGTAFPGGAPDCIKLGTGTAVDTTDGLNAPLDTTATKCSGDATINAPGPSQVCNTDGTTTGAAAICTIITEHTTAGDCSPSCVISEASFGAGTSGNQDLSNLFSYTNFGTDVTANEGAVVTTTYRIAFGGPIV